MQKRYLHKLRITIKKHFCYFEWDTLRQKFKLHNTQNIRKLGEYVIAVFVAF